MFSFCPNSSKKLTDSNEKWQEKACSIARFFVADDNFLFNANFIVPSKKAIELPVSNNQIPKPKLNLSR